KDGNGGRREVTNSQAEAAVGDLPAVREMIRKGHPKLKTVGSLLSDEKVGLAMRQAEPELTAAVNAALKKIRATGEYDRIYQRWLREKPAGANSTTPALFRVGLFRRVWRPLVRGAWSTLRLTLLSLLFGLPLGLLAALGRISHFPPLSLVAGFYVEAVRGTPLLVQIFFVYY